MNRQMTKRMVLRLKYDGRILLRVFGYGNRTFGIKEWKFQKVEENYLVVKLVLGPVVQKTGDGLASFIINMPAIDYVLDPYTRQIIRAKLCYSTALVHSKERRPVVFSERTELIDFYECYGGNFFKFDFSNEVVYSKTMPLVFYPWTKETYSARLKNIHVKA